jgi:hypothetical protein
MLHIGTLFGYWSMVQPRAANSQRRVKRVCRSYYAPTASDRLFPDAP